MRHASIDTTMKYYVNLDAEDLWANHGPDYSTSDNNGQGVSAQSESVGTQGVVTERLTK